MRRPERPSERPDVVDLKARRRVAQLKAAATRKSARSPARPSLTSPLAAWAILILAALVWALIRWFSA